MLKLFIIKKYVWAKSAQHALKKEKNTPPDDVWIDEDWKKASSSTTPPMGFYTKIKKNG